MKETLSLKLNGHQITGAIFLAAKATPDDDRLFAAACGTQLDGHCDAAVAATLLHDALNGESPVTVEDILRDCGELTAKWAQQLRKRADETYLARALRLRDEGGRTVKAIAIRVAEVRGNSNALSILRQPKRRTRGEAA